MLPRTNYPDYQKNFQGLNGALGNEMIRQDPFVAPEMFSSLPIYYPDMAPPTSKTPPQKFATQMNGMYKNMQYEETYGYMQEPQIMMHMPPIDQYIQYQVPYQIRPQQTNFRNLPNPTANAYVPQEPTKVAPKQTEFKPQNQVKIKNIPEFVPKFTFKDAKEGELIQVQVYQSAFSNEKDKKKYGVMGLIKQQDEEDNQLLNSMDLRNIGIQLNTQGLSNNLSSPFAKQQTTITDLPNFVLPSCYAQLKPSLRNSHFQKFAEETLLYIFYFFPKDQLQTLAAEELYNKDWKFCEQDKRWYKNNCVWDTTQWKSVQCDQQPSVFLSKEKVQARRITPQ